MASKRRRHLAVTPATETVTPEVFAARLTDAALHCRELGHTWRPLVARWESDSRSFHRRLRCSKCRTERVQLLSSRGHIVSNHYVYPDGYLAKNVEGAVGGRRDLYRLEAVIRQLDEADMKAVRKAVS